MPSAEPGREPSDHLSNINKGRDFAGGEMVKNLLANAGDMGSISGLGRTHMP